MKTTRQRVWEYLQNRKIASAGEMSRALHVTAADIRHHLSIMVDEGVVDLVGQRKGGGRGRPTQLYGLAEQFSGHNLDNLADALLAELLSSVSPENRDEFLERLGRSLAGNGQGGGRKAGQKLVAAVDRLNEMHYQARWEAHAQGPRVIFNHCPYASILPAHPEMCLVDHALLENMLGSAVHQLSRRERSAQGLLQCVFLMGKRENV